MSHCGSHKVIDGKAISSASLRMSAYRNGITPFQIELVGTSGSMLLITKMFMPTGGLIMPISTTQTISTPNQTGSSPRCLISGKKIGTVSRIIDSSSIAVPRIT